MSVQDAVALVTVLLNLLDNAYKYTDDDRHIELRVSAASGQVFFAVRDNGMGIAERDQKKIFRRFYQVDRRLADQLHEQVDRQTQIWREQNRCLMRGRFDFRALLSAVTRGRDDERNPSLYANRKDGHRPRRRRKVDEDIKPRFQGQLRSNKQIQGAKSCYFSQVAS